MLAWRNHEILYWFHSFHVISLQLNCNSTVLIYWCQNSIIKGKVNWRGGGAKFLKVDQKINYGCAKFFHRWAISPKKFSIPFSTIPFSNDWSSSGWIMPTFFFMLMQSLSHYADGISCDADRIRYSMYFSFISPNKYTIIIMLLISC